MSFLGFIGIVALFMLGNSKAGMRGMGVMMLVQAGVHLFDRRIPYGWEGREPSGHISGTAAVVIAVLLAGLGLAMLFKPDLMLVIFGWAEV